jgi:hypothetical protein
VGSSFTEFRDYGFWSRDQFIEAWLRALAAECRKLEASEPWLAEACEHWELQATGIFSGWVHAMLDEFLTDADRVSLITSISERVKNNYPPGHSLNKTGDLFIRLLKGELLTKDSSPLDYMVGYDAN